MASSFVLQAPWAITTNLSCFPSFTKPSHVFPHKKPNNKFKVSCNQNNEANNSQEKVERRNLLLGLGGIYGAAHLLPYDALASPIPSPTLTQCGTAIIEGDKPVPYTCCPPIPEIKDVPYYNPPPVSRFRVRPAAHTVDDEYIAKYNEAYSRMKALPTDDPRSFMQQANIHCAYCNGAYKVGGKELQVHFSWLFFPFHRWYIYFYERILASLIDDPTFALPYWNWDNPKGMHLPDMFDVEGTSIYNERRNQKHRNGFIMDLGYAGEDVVANDLQKLVNNLTLMYRQMITNAPCPSLFFGKPYRFGSEPSPGMGTIENVPHNSIHRWVGDPRQPNEEDMGNFYSSGKDPAFFSLHANVDRMWTIWKTLGGKRKDISDPDYLDTEFFFYDEKAKPFRVRVRDCLDEKKLGYTFQPMDIPWKNFKPQPRKNKKNVKIDPNSVPPASQVFPIKKLDKTVTFSVARPKRLRTKKEKEDEEELLTFKNVELDVRKFVRFDVFLNEDNDVIANEIDRTEFVGSFANLPHIHDDPKKEKFPEFSLAINELLEDLKLEGDDLVVVTLVPKSGGENVSIEAVEIQLVPC
uniref:catechol oxidase n=1 Tax=Nicotiana tabacum TaxID=4097 RepID=A0A1S3X216_TOBAC|nr:PREDICTED: polyphenol oxidase E, chloroplastic-like [Nicotiana tabacum]